MKNKQFVLLPFLLLPFLGMHSSTTTKYVLSISVTDEPREQVTFEGRMTRADGFERIVSTTPCELTLEEVPFLFSILPKRESVFTLSLKKIDQDGANILVSGSSLGGHIYWFPPKGGYGYIGH